MPDRIGSILLDIRDALDAQYPGTRDTDWYQKFGLRYRISGMEIDVFIGSPDVHPKDFLSVLDVLQSAYMSASVSRYSTNFMKKQSPCFKDLVRVVKDWRDSYANWPDQCKPKSYLLEVLLLHACKEAAPKLFLSRRCIWGMHGLHLTENLANDVLVHFFRMIGDIPRYQKGQTYDKDTVSIRAIFYTYYQESDIPLDTPEPLFQKSIRKKNAPDKIRHASCIALDPANPHNNLWLTLATANPFIDRAKATYKQMS